MSPLLAEEAPLRARDLFRLSAPVSPDVHAFETELGLHLLVPNGNRVFRVDRETHRAVVRAQADRGGLKELLVGLGLDGPAVVDDEPPARPPLRAISLAVAQKCNLGCAYCYADGGDFGGSPKNMPLETALAAVRRLVGEATRGDRVNLAFLGGEPLVNRPVVRAATEEAAALGEARGVDVTFSITTNGTLIRPEDADFFERHAFAVTVSLDGLREAHDRLRPFKGGRGSFDRILERVAPLLVRQRRMQVSARVTVTPRNLELEQTLDAFIGLGFHSVGFSPLLASPSGAEEMALPELEAMLDELLACGAEFERRVLAGERYPFSNMVNAMREIHRGTHRPYPCGAGAGYLGVSADGDLAACHRFVGDEEGALGDLETGIDRERQALWLTDRHVHRQEPCRKCWARYMCGGGCHHEVIRRGRPACDFIRGWLHYCLGAYSRLVAARPESFGLAG